MKNKADDKKWSFKGFSGVSFPALAENQLLKWFEGITESSATAYDKALDMDYLKTHIGGGDHRLFDNGHDVVSAWERAQDALPDDTFAQEVIGYTSALWKDVTTSKGLPFATVEKESFDSWVEAISGWNIPGLDRKYLYDLLSFDAMEVISSGVGIFGVLFALKKSDKEKLAQILASMGIVTVTSANPIIGIITVGLACYSYKVKKAELDKKSLLRGGVLTSTSVLIFSILGLPFLIELMVVLFVSHLLKKHLFAKTEVLDHFKSEVIDLSNVFRERAKGLASDINKKVG